MSYSLIFVLSIILLGFVIMYCMFQRLNGQFEITRNRFNDYCRENNKRTREADNLLFDKLKEQFKKEIEFVVEINYPDYTLDKFDVYDVTLKTKHLQTNHFRSEEEMLCYMYMTIDTDTIISQYKKLRDVEEKMCCKKGKK